MSTTPTAFSKFYSRKPYWYWWDVWDKRKDALQKAGRLILVQKDTGRRAVIRADDLLPLLTKERRTSRMEKKRKKGKGNWGLYVRPNRPNEIEVEGGKRGTPAAITVQWQDT